MSDPQLSTAKRKQRTHAFHSQMSFASLERQVASLQTSKAELEAKLREKDAAIERLEGDRRWLADREKEEKEMWKQRALLYQAVLESHGHEVPSFGSS